MKKLPFIILLAALTACNSNSLINTPTLPPTLTPIPTPMATNTPEPAVTATETLIPIEPISYEAPAGGWNAEIAAMLENPIDGMTDMQAGVDENGDQTFSFHSGVSLTEDEMKARLEADDKLLCPWSQCIFRSNDYLLIGGLFTGDMKIIFKPDGSKELVTSIVTINNLLGSDNKKLQTIKLRIILDKRNSVNDEVYRNLNLDEGVQEFTIRKIAELFKAGNIGDLPVRMIPRSTSNPSWDKYGSKYNDGKYYEAVEAWYNKQLDPKEQGNLQELILTTLMNPKK